MQIGAVREPRQNFVLKFAETFVAPIVFEARHAWRFANKHKTSLRPLGSRNHRPTG